MAAQRPSTVSHHMFSNRLKEHEVNLKKIHGSWPARPTFALVCDEVPHTVTWLRPPQEKTTALLYARVSGLGTACRQTAGMRSGEVAVPSLKELFKQHTDDEKTFDNKAVFGLAKVEHKNASGDTIATGYLASQELGNTAIIRMDVDNWFGADENGGATWPAGIYIDGRFVGPIRPKAVRYGTFVSNHFRPLKMKSVSIQVGFALFCSFYRNHSCCLFISGRREVERAGRAVGREHI